MSPSQSGSDDGLYFILSVSLGSTSLMVRSDGVVKGKLRYKAFGDTRYTSGTIPTSFNFTGQRNESSLTLMWYGSRWFDTSLGRFIQPDTIIPNPYNPQDWDRYAYSSNNPINYNDPSGHAQQDPKDGGCDSICQNLTRQTYLLSLVLNGSGSNGAWTGEDYKYYYSNVDGIWSGKTPWVHPDQPGWDTFAKHVGRLAMHYANNERDQFVRDFSLLFSGIRYDVPWEQAAMEVRGGHTLVFLNEGTQGLPTQYIDTLRGVADPEQNQSHHYAGLFFLGYFTDEPTAVIINIIRDTIDPGFPPSIAYNPGDIALGNVAANHGNWLRFAYAQNSAYGNPILDLAGMITGLGR